MKSSRFFFITLLSLVGFSNSFAGVAILNGLTHFHSGSFGSTLTGTIKLKNSGKKDVRMLIYQQDMLLFCDKPLDYNNINAHDRSLGKWMKTNVEEKVMQPDEEYEVSYTITIPQDAKDKGTFWGIIMVEGAEPIREETAQGVKIDAKTRYAVQILMDVGATQYGTLSFEKVDLQKKTIDSTKTTSYTILTKIKNSGMFYNRAKLSVEIFNSNGEKIKVIEGLSKKIYPDRCSEFIIELKDVPKGKYEGVIVADNGKELFGSNLSLEIE
jgi:hypothetical protein